MQISLVKFFSNKLWRDNERRSVMKLIFLLFGKEIYKYLFLIISLFLTNYTIVLSQLNSF
jgi:hypothetical protein